MYRHSAVVNNVARRKRLYGLIGGTNRCERRRRGFIQIVLNMKPHRTVISASSFLIRGARNQDKSVRITAMIRNDDLVIRATRVA